MRYILIHEEWDDQKFVASVNLIFHTQAAWWFDDALLHGVCFIIETSTYCFCSNGEHAYIELIEGKSNNQILYSTWSKDVLEILFNCVGKMYHHFGQIQ